VLPGYTTPLDQPRYLFCLATRKITGSTRLIGIRQGVTLGVDANFGTPPERPIEMPIVTPTWHPSDGNISWHVVWETNPRRVQQMPTSNAAGWSFLEAEGASMLYKDASFAAGTFDPATGAPYYYPLGLTTYDPPPIAIDWKGVGGYGNFHDLRFSWYGAQWGSVNERIEGTGRLSLYASVLQTNPATRTPLPTPPVTPWITPQLTPEEAFLAAWNLSSEEEATAGPIYWRIYGALIFEDDDPDQVEVIAAP
jgi:hypothetical protein